MTAFRAQTVVRERTDGVELSRALKRLSTP
jgi:hypothetical protein